MDLPTTIPLATVRPQQQPSANQAANQGNQSSASSLQASLQHQVNQINAAAAVANVTAAQIAAIQNAMLSAQAQGAATNMAAAGLATVRQQLGYATAPSAQHNSAGQPAPSSASASLHPYHLPLELIYHQPSFVFPPQHQTAAAAAAAITPCLLTQAVCQSCAFSSPSQPCNIHHAPIPYGQATSYTAAVAAVATAANSSQLASSIAHQHLAVAATAPAPINPNQPGSLLNPHHGHLGSSGSTSIPHIHRDEAAIRQDLESARHHSYIQPVSIRSIRIKRSAVAAALNSSRNSSRTHRNDHTNSSSQNRGNQGSTGNGSENSRDRERIHDGCSRPVAKLRRVASDSGREMQAFQSDLTDTQHSSSEPLLQNQQSSGSSGNGSGSGSSGRESGSSNLQVVTGPVVTTPSNTTHSLQLNSQAMSSIYAQVNDAVLRTACSLCCLGSNGQHYRQSSAQQAGSSQSGSAASVNPPPASAIISPAPLPFCSGDNPNCPGLIRANQIAQTAAVHQPAQPHQPGAGQIQTCSPCVCAYCPHGNGSASTATAQTGIAMPVQTVAAHQISSSAQAALSAGIQIVPATDPAAALARIAASPMTQAQLRQHILSNQPLTAQGPTRFYHSIMLTPTRPVSSIPNLLEYSMLIMPSDALNFGERTLERHHMFAPPPPSEPQPVGVSPQDIEKCTEKIQFVKDIEIPDSEVERCTVCLDEFQNGEEVRTLKCAHLFHVNCIDKWLVYNKKCPVCRLDVDKHNEGLAEENNTTATAT
ncbi:hypothetical protein WR25_08229 isoform A [Diploscapter pachys]|uniref:RING-type domain-containing protein n=2 Tax=Diploscapter pachys TaxID=2018661 RepID=A0A2A2LHN0_9BILA|nr:hypothetical protein WR25_08229 isoform A [Diploscapter pachys]